MFFYRLVCKRRGKAAERIFENSKIKWLEGGMFVSDWSILLKFGLRRVYLVQIIHSLSFLRLIHSSSSLEIIHFFIPYVGSSENDAWVLTGWSKKKQKTADLKTLYLILWWAFLCYLTKTSPLQMLNTNSTSLRPALLRSWFSVFVQNRVCIIFVKPSICSEYTRILNMPMF